MSRRLTAKTADKFRLYEMSVQDPEVEIAFIRRVFKSNFARYPHAVREDFCGTAYFSCAWVAHRRKHTAIGVDLDRRTLRWAHQHNVSALGERASRLTLLRKDVREVTVPKVDVVASFNFSYCVFKERRLLTDYFRRVRRSLRNEGCLFLDLYGGPESIQELEEERREKGFIYVWDQARYSPVTGEITCHIHFKFHDGTSIRRAFTYDWRLWTLPEIREMLEDAGFSRVDVYWEGADEDGDGNGVYRRTRRGTADDAWVSYIVGIKE